MNGPIRMCSCCRKEIARAADSLTLNGMFAHVACVEAVLREPGAMAVVTDLSLTTDDQLRAECERRGMTKSQVMSDAWHRDRDMYIQQGAEAIRERDEWKRRAEAAEERVTSLEARINKGYLPTIARYMRLNEVGPGIAAAKPDTSHWVDPWDVAEDA